MATDIVTHLHDKWEQILEILPAEVIEESAREKKAIVRLRAIKSGQMLLRLILMYAVLQSLRLTTLLAASMGLCDISGQALQQRVHKAEDWLVYLVNYLLARMADGATEVIRGVVQRIVLVDGSMIARPGSTGTEWRLYLAWDPVHLRTCDLALSGPEQGESVGHFTLRPGDLAIGDRVYGVWRQIALVLAAGAFFLFRIPWNTLRLQTPEGAPFDLIGWLRHIPKEENVVREVTVTVADDKQQRPLRLIAGRLSQEGARKAKKRVQARAARKKRSPHPHTLLAAEFCLVITNLPESIPATIILKLYRIRWQIEWCFRRWKSIWELDKLPARPASIAYPVLLAKLLIVLLLQHQLGACPWDTWTATVATPPALSRFARLAYRAFQAALLPPQAVFNILDNPLRFARHLRLSKRERDSQFYTSRSLFAQLRLLALT